MVEIKEINSRSGLRKFIGFQWEIYRGDENWVPPLRSDMMKSLIGKSNPLFLSGPHALFMAYEGERPLGRLCVGINETLNSKRGQRDGYISLFECVKDYNVAEALFDKAAIWLKERNIDCVKGPVSPTNGDDSKGLLVKGFDGAPVLMNSYNPEYYVEFFEKYGFEKHEDLYAYYYTHEGAEVENYKKIIEYAMKRYKFRIDTVDLKNLDNEARDFKKVMDVSMPEWEDLTPPSLEDVKAEINQLKAFADPELIFIARSDDEPVGFLISLPDYNQVLKRMNGRILPFGFIKFLKYRKRINGVRLFVIFVVPEFRKKAVSSAMLYKCFENSLKKGYVCGEGSTVGESNLEMRRDCEKAGGKHYRTYRIYKKNI